MIKHINFRLHNMQYTLLVENLVKPGSELFSTTINSKEVEVKKGITFRDIEEIDFDTEPTEEFHTFKFYRFSNCIAETLFVINSLGQGLFISISKDKTYQFYLSSFNKLPKKSEDNYILNQNITKDIKIESIAKALLIYNEAVFLDEADKIFYKKVLNELKESQMWYVNQHMINNGSREEIFRLILNSSEKIFEKNFNEKELLDYIEEFKRLEERK